MTGQTDPALSKHRAYILLFSCDAGWVNTSDFLFVVWTAECLSSCLCHLHADYNMSPFENEIFAFKQSRLPNCLFVKPILQFEESPQIYFRVVGVYFASWNLIYNQYDTPRLRNALIISARYLSSKPTVRIYKHTYQCNIFTLTIQLTHRLYNCIGNDSISQNTFSVGCSNDFTSAMFFVFVWPIGILGKWNLFHYG